MLKRELRDCEKSQRSVHERHERHEKSAAFSVSFADQIFPPIRAQDFLHSL